MVIWDASAYHRSSAAQQHWAEELLTKLELKGDENLLDLGCGDGRITATIATTLRDGCVVGVDSSAEMITFAKQTYHPDRYPNITFCQMDARELTFDEQFDVVFSNAALHWIVDHRPVLQGIAHALKPGGRCLLQMGGYGNAASMYTLLAPGTPLYQRWQHYLADIAFPYGFHAPDDYRGWLEQSGLHPRRVELFPRDMCQPGADGLAAWVRTTWLPFTQRIPPSEREVFIADLIDTYLADHPLDSEDRAHIPMVRLEVDAVKA